jgi:hypothetical protein
MIGAIKSKKEGGAAFSKELSTIVNLLNSAGCAPPSYKDAAALPKMDPTRPQYPPGKTNPILSSVRVMGIAWLVRQEQSAIRGGILAGEP